MPADISVYTRSVRAHLRAALSGDHRSDRPFAVTYSLGPPASKITEDEDNTTDSSINGLRIVVNPTPQENTTAILPKPPAHVVN